MQVISRRDHWCQNAPPPASVRQVARTCKLRRTWHSETRDEKMRVTNVPATLSASRQNTCAAGKKDRDTSEDRSLPALNYFRLALEEVTTIMGHWHYMHYNAEAQETKYQKWSKCDLNQQKNTNLRMAAAAMVACQQAANRSQCFGRSQDARPENTKTRTHRAINTQTLTKMHRDKREFTVFPQLRQVLPTSSPIPTNVPPTRHCEFPAHGPWLPKYRPDRRNWSRHSQDGRKIPAGC